MRNPIVEFEDAVRIEATFDDFDGGLDKWKKSFYEIWRYQMTFDFAYRIELCERRSGVYVLIIARPAYRKPIMETMGDLGYRNIYESDVLVATFSEYDIEDKTGKIVDDVFLE